MASSPTLESLERLAESTSAGAGIQRKRMLVIVNPYATTVSDRLRHLVVYALQGRYEVTSIDTEAKGHATELCREAALEGYDVVVAFGGDGTVNEAVNGLAGTPTPLSCLPGGATNVYCKLLGIPGEIVDATEHLLRIADDWRPRRVDLAKVNDRFYAFSAGFGLDATVVQRVDSNPKLKRRLGPYYYTYAALTSFSRHYLVRPPLIEVSAGGRTVRGVTAIVQNGETYTYFRDRPITLAEESALDGGSLSTIVLERASPIDMPTVLFRAFAPGTSMARHRRVTGIEGVDEVVARTMDGRAVPLQVDGDYVGDVEEARFSLDPGGLTVVS